MQRMKYNIKKIILNEFEVCQTKHVPFYFLLLMSQYFFVQYVGVHVKKEENQEYWIVKKIKL